MKREFSHAASVRGAACLCDHWDPRSLTSVVSAHDPAQFFVGGDEGPLSESTSVLIVWLVVCYGPRDNFSCNKPAVLLRILPWSGKRKSISPGYRPFRTFLRLVFNDDQNDSSFRTIRAISAHSTGCVLFREIPDQDQSSSSPETWKPWTLQTG